MTLVSHLMSPCLTFLTQKMEITKHKFIMRTLVNMYKMLMILPIHTKCSVNISLKYYSFVSKESKTQRGQNDFPKGIFLASKKSNICPRQSVP